MKTFAISSFFRILLNDLRTAIFARKFLIFLAFLFSAAFLLMIATALGKVITVADVIVGTAGGILLMILIGVTNKWAKGLKAERKRTAYVTTAMHAGSSRMDAETAWIETNRAAAAAQAAQPWIKRFFKSVARTLLLLGACTVILFGIIVALSAIN